MRRKVTAAAHPGLHMQNFPESSRALQITNEKSLFLSFLEREERRVAYVVAAVPRCPELTQYISYMAERMAFRSKELQVEKAALEEALAKEEAARALAEAEAARKAAEDALATTSAVAQVEDKVAVSRGFKGWADAGMPRVMRFSDRP